MSYFYQEFPDQLVTSMASSAAFATRVNLGTGVRGAVASPITQTTAAFTIPAFGSNVTISVSSSANFVAGDFVMVGSRGMYLTSPVHAATGPGTLSFSGRYFAGRAPSADASPAGIAIIGPSGQFTTLTANVPALPDYINITAANIIVADRAQIPSDSWVLLTNYAGVYKVVSAPTGTSLQLTYVSLGDLPEGATCIVDTSGSDTGAAVVQFYPLGIVPKGYIFTFTDAFLMTVSTSVATASTPNISIGFTPSQYTSGPATRFGDYVDNAGQQAATVMTPGFAMKVSGQKTNTDPERLTPISGMAFGIRVNTPASTSFIQDIFVRGLLTPFI